METTQQTSEPPIKTPDFGEPWHPDKTWPQIICNKGGVHAMVDVFDKTPGLRDRIISCVNATAGMADPAKEIQAMRDAFKETALAAVCQERDARIEINSNVVALFKLPIPLQELASTIEHLEVVHKGHELRMLEQPKGWLQFFKP
jgi:hypothetical protein